MREATRQKELRADMVELEVNAPPIPPGFVWPKFKDSMAKANRDRRNWIWSINKKGKERVGQIDYIRYQHTIAKARYEDLMLRAEQYT